MAQTNPKFEAVLTVRGIGHRDSERIAEEEGFDNLDDLGVMGKGQGMSEKW
jgi:hypothetical protein